MFRAAQIVMALSILATLRTLRHTAGHAFNDNFMGEAIGRHMNFHGMREVFMAMGLVVVVAIIMYGPRTLRTPANWWIMTVASVFVTVGVWASLPIVGVSFPTLGASLNHILNTLFAAIALGLCFKSYHPSSQ